MELLSFSRAVMRSCRQTAERRQTASQRRKMIREADRVEAGGMDNMEGKDAD